MSVFDVALADAKIHGGIIAGSWPAQRLCPSIRANDIDIFAFFSNDLHGSYDIENYAWVSHHDDGYFVKSNKIEPWDIFVRMHEGIKIQLILCYRTEPDAVIEDVIDEFDMDICRCWYDANGNFHTTDAAVTAASTRVLNVTKKTTLERIRKYRGRGFVVNAPKFEYCTAYSVDIEEIIVENHRIKRLIFSNMRITKDLIQRLMVRRWEWFSFEMCEIDTNIIEYNIKLEFSHCTFNDATVIGGMVGVYQDSRGRGFFGGRDTRVSRKDNPSLKFVALDSVTWNL